MEEFGMKEEERMSNDLDFYFLFQEFGKVGMQTEADCQFYKWRTVTQ